MNNIGSGDIVQSSEHFDVKIALFLDLHFILIIFAHVAFYCLIYT